MKIYIVGGPGSGKTTLAKQISVQHNIPHFDLDDINWETKDGKFYGQKRDKNERQKILSEILSENTDWVIEGVYVKDWIIPIVEQSDQVILLNPSRWLRFYRILKRFIRRKIGLEKSQHPEPLSSLWRLIRWNHGYDKESLRPFLENLKKNKTSCIFVK